MSAMVETTMQPLAPLGAALDAPVSDDVLIALVRGGDQAAFEQLVERHKRSVYNLAYRMLGNPADAEDAAQETFLRAYTRLATYAPDSRFGAWLAAICSHWCIDTIRARQRRVQTVGIGRVMESDRFLEGGNEPEDRALDRDGYDQVQGWLSALPTQYRTILSLRYFQDLSYNEIADVLAEPVSTVRMRLFRARNMLAKLVEKSRRAEGSVQAFALSVS